MSKPDNAGVLNHYHCEDCNIDWISEWDCACEDECPECGMDYSPQFSMPCESKE